jgi:hypothetical protein
MRVFALALLLLLASPAGAQWIDEPYSPAKFKAVAFPIGSSDVAWRVERENVAVYKYLMLTPDTMMLDFYIAASTVEGTPLRLEIAVPGGYHLLPSDTSGGFVEWFENTYEATGIGRIAVDAHDGDFLRITKIPYRHPPAAQNNWDASNGTYVSGQITFRVMR